jgi:hypothetical protein
MPQQRSWSQCAPRLQPPTAQSRGRVANFYPAHRWAVGAGVGRVSHCLTATPREGRRYNRPMTHRWVPRSKRGTDAEPAHVEVLHEGVPPHLISTLRTWLRTRLSNATTVLQLERELEVSFDYDPRDQSSHIVYQVEQQIWNGDDDFILDVIDWALHDLERQVSASIDPALRVRKAQTAISLDESLGQAGSAYTVSIVSDWSLVRRVDETLAALTSTVASGSTDAAVEIGEAWKQCYKRDPDYDDAYKHAVLAVESVASALFTPNDPSPSLGKAVAHLKSTTAKWTVGGLDAPQITSGEALLTLLQMLWHNHRRHVSQGGSPPPPVTKEEAEAGVSLAVTLIHWFNSGLVRKK